MFHNFTFDYIVPNFIVIVSPFEARLRLVLSISTEPSWSIESRPVRVQLWIFIVFVTVHAPKALAKTKTIAARLDKLPKIDQSRWSRAKRQSQLKWFCSQDEENVMNKFGVLSRKLPIIAVVLWSIVIPTHI